MMDYDIIMDISYLKGILMGNQIKLVKRCVAESGKVHWLRTHIIWIRPGNIVRSIKDGKIKEDVTYKATTFPFWNKVHQCWDIKLAIWDKSVE